MSESDDDLKAPKLKEAGKGIYVTIKENPWIVLLLAAMIVVLLYLYPVQTVLFFVTVLVSITMATLMHILLNSKRISRYGLTHIEKAIISGGVAGVTGFIVGTWAEIKLIPHMNWSPLTKNI